MGSRTLKCANIFTPRTLNRYPSVRWFSSVQSLSYLGQDDASRTSCDGVSEAVEYTYGRNGNGEHVVGRNLEIGGGTNGMEIARPGSSLMTVRPLYSFRSYYSL